MKKQQNICWAAPFPCCILWIVVLFFVALSVSAADVRNDMKTQRVAAMMALDFGDAPDPTYPTLEASDGARHIINPDVYLGATVDGESDGQQNADATGDDNDGNNDDDGVVFNTPLFPGADSKVTVTTSTEGYLSAWIDKDIDGTWDSMEDKVISNMQVNAGENDITIFLPSSTKPGVTFARFRFTSLQSHLEPTGFADDGEVEDYKVTIHAVPEDMLDFGDAPDPPYYTLRENYGAHHIINSNHYLGQSVDAESDGQPNADATGDDNDGNNDDDGVVLKTSLIPGFTAVVEVTASAAGYLNAWIDFDISGDWESMFDRIFAGEHLNAGKNILTFQVPQNAKEGTTQSRWRYSTEMDVFCYSALIFDGEVEDYELTIGGEPEFDFGDAPEPMYPTTLSSDGARHAFDPFLFLGSQIDIETDGIPDIDALGDDDDGIDDEDGVTLTSPVLPGKTATLTVVASAQGMLDAWMDFGADGWNEAEDQIFASEPLQSGLNALSFNVPASALIGHTLVRFRFSSAGGLDITGLADDGEVEDYYILIEYDQTGSGWLKWSQPSLKNADSEFPDAYWGWDEPSVYGLYLASDDWFCYDQRAVTGIRWWGSYQEWSMTDPPPNAPWGFHIGIWTDIPKGETEEWSHPGILIREWKVSRSAANEQPDGSDYHSGRMSVADTCFTYEFNIPHTESFYQEYDSTVYWLSIAAIYDSIPDSTLWGWKTRERYFNDDAVRIDACNTPTVDSLYRTGEMVQEGWDLSFELFTTKEDEGFDFGDAPDPSYPTLHASNGAEHIPWPGLITLGSVVDFEYDGQPDATAQGDDNDGSNDDDGVVFTTDIEPGNQTDLVVTATSPGYLNAWMDFDGDGTWDGTDEQIFIDQPLVAGSNALQFDVPAQASISTTFARFRAGDIPGFGYSGILIGGEVEDYEISITTDVNSRIHSGQPIKFRLAQNHPNPFNASTEIQYAIPKNGQVRLSVYNLSGQEVRVLVDKPVKAGKHAVTWDTRDDRGHSVSSGLYVYRITAGNHTDSKKLLLMK